MPDLKGARVNDVGGGMDERFLATLEDDRAYASASQEQSKGAAGRTAAHDNNLVVGHWSARCLAVERWFIEGARTPTVPRAPLAEGGVDADVLSACICITYPQKVDCLKTRM